MNCLPICREDSDKHIGNIFLSGGTEHGSKGKDLLVLQLLYLLGVIELIYNSMVSFQTNERRRSRKDKQ